MNNFSVNGDAAGAEFCVFTGELNSSIGGWQKGYNNYSSNYKIWMKPADSLKIILGHNAFELNQETILYSKTYSKIDDRGYSINFDMNGFSLDVMFAPGWGTYWLDNENTSLTGFKAQYSADFGKINGILYTNNSFKDLRFGAGYSNNFGGVNMFVNAIGFTKESKMDYLRFETFASGGVGAFCWAIFPAVNVNLAGEKADVELFLTAKGSYAINGLNVYLIVGQDSRNQYGYNYIADQGTYFGLVESDKFNMTIAPGISGNVGIANWDVSLKFDIGKDQPILISVPVIFSVAF